MGDRRGRHLAIVGDRVEEEEEFLDVNQDLSKSIGMVMDTFTG